jgi:hypothetical protein
MPTKYPREIPRTKTTVIVTVSENAAKTAKILQATVTTVIMTVSGHLVFTGSGFWTSGFHRIGNRIGDTD